MSVRPTTSFLPLPQKDATKRNVMGRTQTADVVRLELVAVEHLRRAGLGHGRRAALAALASRDEPARFGPRLQGANAATVDPTLGVDVAGFRDGDGPTRGRGRGNDARETKCENAHVFLVLIEVVYTVECRSRTNTTLAPQL